MHATAFLSAITIVVVLCMSTVVGQPNSARFCPFGPELDISCIQIDHPRYRMPMSPTSPVAQLTSQELQIWKRGYEQPMFQAVMCAFELRNGHSTDDTVVIITVGCEIRFESGDWAVLWIDHEPVCAVNMPRVECWFSRRELFGWHTLSVAEVGATFTSDFELQSLYSQRVYIPMVHNYPERFGPNTTTKAIVFSQFGREIPLLNVSAEVRDNSPGGDLVEKQEGDGVDVPTVELPLEIRDEWMQLVQGVDEVTQDYDIGPSCWVKEVFEAGLKVVADVSCTDELAPGDWAILYVDGEPVVAMRTKHTSVVFNRNEMSSKPSFGIAVMKSAFVNGKMEVGAVTNEISPVTIEAAEWASTIVQMGNTSALLNVDVAVSHSNKATSVSWSCSGIEGSESRSDATLLMLNGKLVDHIYGILASGSFVLHAANVDVESETTVISVVMARDGIAVGLGTLSMLTQMLHSPFRSSSRGAARKHDAVVDNGIASNLKSGASVRLNSTTDAEHHQYIMAVHLDLGANVVARGGDVMARVVHLSDRDGGRTEVSIPLSSLVRGDEHGVVRATTINATIPSTLVGVENNSIPRSMCALVEVVQNTGWSGEMVLHRSWVKVMQDGYTDPILIDERLPETAYGVVWEVLERTNTSHLFHQLREMACIHDLLDAEWGNRCLQLMSAGDQTRFVAEMRYRLSWSPPLPFSCPMRNALMPQPLPSVLRPRLRIAVLISGRIRKSKYTFANFYQFVVQPGNEADVFLSHTPEDHPGEDVERFFRMYNLTRVVDFPSSHTEELLFLARTTVRPHSILSMFQNRLRCFELLEEYMEETGKTYDFVVSYRADLFAYENMPYDLLGKLLYEGGAAASKTVLIPKREDWGGINDQIAVGTYESMLVYMTLYNNLAGVLGSIPKHANGERALTSHLETMQMNVVRYNFLYRVLRSK